MTTQHQRHHLFRFAIAGAFLLAGLGGTAQVASAASPFVDPGGPGGGGTEVADRPIYLEHFGLVATNDPSESITGHTRLDGPSLVGSGPDREIVANSTRQQTAGTLDEAKRSQALIALGPSASSDVALAPTEARHGQSF